MEDVYARWKFFYGDERDSVFTILEKSKNITIFGGYTKIKLLIILQKRTKTVF